MQFRPDHPTPHAGPPRKAPRHGPEAARAVEIERTLPTTAHDAEIARGL
ncbi:MAG: hypothetical protein QOE59_2750, partial [Actinomycetota bacterium]|nr:hypothetical protein [Actinomycetota bacterium]